MQNVPELSRIVSHRIETRPQSRSTDLAKTRSVDSEDLQRNVVAADLPSDRCSIETWIIAKQRGRIDKTQKAAQIRIAGPNIFSLRERQRHREILVAERATCAV